MALRLSVALACCVLAAACGPSEWRPMDIAEGGFRVLMRGQPQVSNQDLQTPAGRMSAHLYSSERPVSYYAVGYSDYPLAFAVSENPDAIFKGVRDTWVRRIGGRTVGADRKLTLAGKYPGVEFSAEGNAKGAPAYLQARLFLVDQRLYQVIVMGRKNEVSQGEINRFLNSFELVTASEVGTIDIKPPVK